MSYYKSGLVRLALIARFVADDDCASPDRGTVAWNTVTPDEGASRGRGASITWGPGLPACFERGDEPC